MELLQQKNIIIDFSWIVEKLRLLRHPAVDLPIVEFLPSRYIKWVWKDLGLYKPPRGWRQSKVGWSALHREEPWRLHNLAARLKTSPNSSLVSAFSTLFVILHTLHYHALEISQSEDILSSWSDIPFPSMFGNFFWSHNSFKHERQGLYWITTKHSTKHT